MLEASKGQAEALPSSAQTSVEAGAIVAGRYVLERILGTGGMGTVWIAHDTSLDSKCALKLVDSEQAKIDEVRVRFEREAKASAQLRGAHVVHVFDYGVWDDVPFIAMELLEGEDLAQRLARVGRLSPEDTYWVVAHICRALSKAHSQGIVHRDLKPENIFLVDTGAEEIAKVVDFGIAKHEGYSVGERTTKIGSFLGTPHYVSPEQARGQSTDGRSDLWAVGVIAYQCITGKLPFASDSLGSLMGQILYDEIPVPSKVANEVSPAFDAWWERASTRKAEGRFQNAQELANALGDAFGIGSRLTVPSLPPRRAFSSAPAGVELRDAASADVSGVRERADLASVVISDSANKPSSGDAQLRLGSLPSDLAAMAPASPALPGTVVPASAVTELRSSSLPVTMLAQRSQLGLSGFEWQQHRWLYAGLAAGLALVIIAIFALASGDNDSRPAGAAQPPDHLAEMEPMRAAQPATEPSIEVKPADTPAIDLVRPEELDMEPEPKPSATPAPLAPRRAPARPSRNSNKRDYGI